MVRGYDDLQEDKMRQIALQFPGVSAQVIQEKLSDAIQKSLADKEIQDWAKKTKSSIDPMSAAKSGENLDTVAKFFGKYKEALGKR